MSSLISPLSFFWTFLICSFIFYRLNRNGKAWKVLLFLGFFQLILFTVTPLPVWMVRHLENKYNVYNPKIPKDCNIMVLGAGHVNDPSLPALQRLSIPVTDRVAEGVRIHNLSPGNKIIFSGFSRMNKSPHAIAMAQAAVSLGVSPVDTIMLVKPSNTWEEAAAYKKRFGGKDKFVLVTSAVHMPRAIEIFNDMGMYPIPAPANFINRNEPGANAYNWWPSSIKAMYTEIAIYEFFSTWYYRWFKRE